MDCDPLIVGQRDIFDIESIDIAIDLIAVKVVLFGLVAILGLHIHLEPISVAGVRILDTETIQ